MAGNSFSISVEDGDRCSIALVAGEVDVATAPELRDHLNDALGKGLPLVVDLLGVTFIDSTGLGVLIEAKKKSESKDIAMRIAVSEPRILKVFSITGLTEFFDIRATVEDAMTG